MPNGTPMMIEISVTTMDPRIIGNMPYRLLPGFHVVPRRNFKGPISAIVGIAEAKRKMDITPTATTENSAEVANMTLNSLSFFIRGLPKW